MCTQTYHVYNCGCRQKGEFEQCDRLYNLGVNLQCAVTNTEDKRSRNYCSNHLLREGKTDAIYDMFTNKKVGGGSAQGGAAEAGGQAEQAQ